VAGGEGDLEPRPGGVVPVAGPRHGLSRPHAHRLLLHVRRLLLSSRGFSDQICLVACSHVELRGAHALDP
jgi:hypothetical protein